VIATKLQVILPKRRRSPGRVDGIESVEMLDRQGKPMDPNDMNAFGMEWQVKPDHGDPMLFSTVEGPQWPKSKYVMPQWVDPKKKRTMNRRRLRGSEDPKPSSMATIKACSRSADFYLCVKDIVTTGEPNSYPAPPNLVSKIVVMKTNQNTHTTMVEMIVLLFGSSS